MFCSSSDSGFLFRSRWWFYFFFLISKCKAQKQNTQASPGVSPVSRPGVLCRLQKKSLSFWGKTLKKAQQKKPPKQPHSVQPIPRGLGSFLSLYQWVAGFLADGSAKHAAFPIAQWPRWRAMAYFSPITVTRSYRICTCFPFTLCPCARAQCKGTNHFILFFVLYQNPSFDAIDSCREIWTKFIFWTTFSKNGPFFFWTLSAL